MGKLTDSLKAAANELDQVKLGIRHMQALGNELADNAVSIAEAGLRTGYAYAQAEAAASDLSAQTALPASSQVLGLDLLQAYNTDRWTDALAKRHFKRADATYRYLRDRYGLKLARRGWKQLVEALNGEGQPQLTSNQSLTQRIADLEQQLQHQAQRITNLEQQLAELLQARL